MTSYVYLITNIINNKGYIGKTNNPNDRFDQHRYGKSYLGNALRYYGKENFLFQIIEEHQTEEEAYEAEKFFIQYLGTQKPYGYNLDTGGLGGRKLSEETKQKIGIAFKGIKRKPFTEETRNRMSEARKGKKLSKETRKKMSEAHKGKKPYEMTDEIRKKLSEANKGKPSGNKGKAGYKHTEEARKKMCGRIPWNKKTLKEHNG